MADSELAVQLSIRIDAAPERVWEAFLSQDGWRRWFHPGVDIEPKVGGRFQISGTHGGRPYAFVGTVLVFEPERRVVVTWAWDPPRYEGETRISYTLIPDGAGTLVRFAHDGFEQLPGPFRQREYESFRSGWRIDEELSALKTLVESGRSLLV